MTSRDEPVANRGAGRWRWWRRLLLPVVPDVIALLRSQAELSAAGMVAFQSWSKGAGSIAADAVRSAQHDAYGARRELLAALQSALSTPIDQEDLFVISERIDRVVVQARNVVREGEVLGWEPDSHAAAMSGHLCAGARAVTSGVALLLKDPQEAGRQADLASEAAHEVESCYRVAMGNLINCDDLREVLVGQDMYRRYIVVAEAVTAVTDRLWAAVLRGA